MSDRRCKIFRMGTSMFAMIFGGGLQFYEVIRDPLPRDAKILSVDHNLIRGDTITFLIASQEFDDVPENSPWPEIEPIFRKIDPDYFRASMEQKEFVV